MLNNWGNERKEMECFYSSPLSTRTNMEGGTAREEGMWCEERIKNIVKKQNMWTTNSNSPPQRAESPRRATWDWKMMRVRGLVKMSAVLTMPGVWLTKKDLDSICERMKWYLISMCLAFPWSESFSERDFAPLLSVETMSGDGQGMWNWLRDWHSQMLLEDIHHRL